MAQLSYPFDAGVGANITEGQWWKMALMWAPDGVLTALRGPTTAGDELVVIGDGSGMVVKVQVGSAWIKGQYYENDTQTTLGPFSPADASNARIDRVVVRIDWTTNTGVLTVLNGTAGVSPVAPFLASSAGVVFDLPLAQVRIRAGTTTILGTDVTDERVYTDVQSTIPPGVMMDYAGSGTPKGWLLCAGQAVSRVTFARLFAAIGTQYGAPSADTFSIPDCRGRVMVTLDNLGGTSAANRLPAATTWGGNGGAATMTLTPTQLPTHHHTINLAPTTDTASADHVHQVDPPSTNSSTESAAHAHAGAAQTLTSGGDSPAHVHDVTVSGTTGNPNSAHHHTSGVGGENFVQSTGGTPALQSGSNNTGDDTPAHQHSFTGTGGTTAASVAHTHSLSIPSANTGNETANHLHAVDISAFNSGGMSANHFHTITVSGNTGDTGSGAAFDLTQPWLALSKLIKF